MLARLTRSYENSPYLKPPKGHGVYTTVWMGGWKRYLPTAEYLLRIEDSENRAFREVTMQLKVYGKEYPFIKGPNLEAKPAHNPFGD